MQQLKQYYQYILECGEWKETRTGKVKSIFDYQLKFDLSEGFPVTTSKKMHLNSVIGELLFFLSGKDNLSDLKHYTFDDRDSPKWTIWTDDQERWFHEGSLHVVTNNGEVGKLYPSQWRNYCDEVDQITKLIKQLKEEPDRRDHIVMAWNPLDIELDRMCLKPCHLGFQCYVSSDEKLSLKFWQRSSDAFLGAPFNITSYALLTHLLADWCGYEVGTLIMDISDGHIYENHLDQVETYLNNKEYKLPILVLPEKAKLGLDECLDLTALDFKDCLVDYESCEAIKAPLSVGK